MTHRDAATRCSFPLSRISLPKAMAGTGSLWDDPAIPMGAGKPGDGPASPQKPLRSQAEKQSIAERLSLGFILVPRKSPLGYYMGQLVPSKTSSFRRSQPTEVHPGAAWQLATHSPSTILSHRAPLGAWLARASPNTIPRTGRATDRNQLRANKILLLPPTRPALDRWRPVSLPRVVRLFKPPSPASQEPKPTSRSKLAPKKATIDARRAQRADWQAAKGKAVKKHIFEEPPVPSETTILDEKEHLADKQGGLVSSVGNGKRLL
ncbi:uncharacterized protein LOC142019005 [Carettochelys insculpta]|uniref:uncharacterized protein LOC142019005 n=1 Tax=Carettochelys insculpta TaxID=44489 RepID=UPI003EBC8CA3